jgi:hypothetical protein
MEAADAARPMSDRTDRLDALLRKSRETGLTDGEARELADLERGGPPPVRSSLLPGEDRERPWQLRYWKGRSLGPLGAVLVVLGIVLIVIASLAREPSVDWRIYEDTGFAFAMEYPNDWSVTPFNQEEPGGQGPRARRVDGVVFSDGKTPAALSEVFLPGFSGPAYGLVIYRPALRAPPVPVLGASPSAVDIGGKPGQEVTTSADGVVTRIAYAQLKNRLVMFFVRTPVGQVEELEAVFDHALRSVRLSGGIEGTPGTSGPTPRE